MNMKALILFLLLPLYSVSFAQSDSSSEYGKMLNEHYKYTVPLMQPAELYKRMKAGETIYLLDTREGKEYAVSSIQGAINVGFLFYSQNRVAEVKKNDLIVVYCTIGARSETIGERLMKSGYNNVYNLYGGIIEWKNLGYPVYQNGKETANVHVYSKKWGVWLTNGKANY